MSSLWLSARSPAVPTGHRREHHPPLALPRHGPRKKEPPFMDGHFDALASRLLERLLRTRGWCSRYVAGAES